jgi:hypothetical protein
MIVVCDVNTIWRHRPFAAMAELTDVLGISPCDFSAVRKHSISKSLPAGAMEVLQVVLPLGWASKTAWLGQRMLWHRIQKKATRHQKCIRCVVITSPHYLQLLDLLPDNIKIVYYASDDYRSYEGWIDIAKLEASVVQKVDHSFFISQALADRACKEYGVSADKVSVSMNATEDRFFPMESEVLPLNQPPELLTRPVAGVIGGINGRLDFELLQACTDIPELGTLLLVGPLPAEPSSALREILEHPKCVSVGAQPHERIHQWFKCLDIGLIPYARTELNKYCSPMRLFDHLASGASLVATDACKQVDNFPERIVICSDKGAFVNAVKDGLVQGASRQFGVDGITWRDRAEHLLKVMEEVCGD